MVHKIKIGVSSCLLGNNVRYDGGNKLNQSLIDVLGQFVEWVPVCPEVGAGLAVPREVMQLVLSATALRLLTVFTGIDHTERLLLWAEKELAELENLKICGFIFKARSPSCGIDDSEIYSLSGEKISKGQGIFVQAFKDRFPSLPIEDEGRLQDPATRAAFIAQVLHYAETTPDLL